MGGGGELGYALGTVPIDLVLWSHGKLGRTVGMQQAHREGDGAPGIEAARRALTQARRAVTRAVLMSSSCLMMPP
jgi:hypothetical protein